MGMMMGGRPPEKSKNFGRSFGRLLGRLRPERWRIAAVVALCAISVVLQVVGPKVLGNATNIIFAGVIGQNLPAGMTQAQVEALLRARGQTQFADMLHGMTVIPGTGIDFAALASILSIFAWGQAYVMAGVTQRTVYSLRRDVDAKLGRLPLKYFDDHPRGDVLSRVTNDIDNIGQTLQQSLTQLITSILTVIGVLVMMLTISWELALISLLAVPASLVVTVLIIRRSQKQFVAQWASTGALNGQVEEMHTGHNIVTVFGRQKEAQQRFAKENERLYQAA
jgi:ATP-binding cassette subfamily B protein